MKKNLKKIVLDFRSKIKTLLRVYYGEKNWPKRRRRATFKFWPKIECTHRV